MHAQSLSRPIQTFVQLFFFKIQYTKVYYACTIVISLYTNVCAIIFKKKFLDRGQGFLVNWYMAAKVDQLLFCAFVHALQPRRFTIYNRTAVKYNNFGKNREAATPTMLFCYCIVIVRPYEQVNGKKTWKSGVL